MVAVFSFSLFPSQNKQKTLKTVLSDQAELERRALLEARSAEEEAEASAPLVSEAERELAEAEKALANARAVLEEASGGRQRRTAALRAALALYERTLGLRFVMPQAAEEEEEEEEEKEGNDVEGQQQQQKQQRSSDSREELKVVFTQVDARDPDRECSLGLHLSSSSSSAESGGSRASYSVLRCEPAACLGAVRRLCAVLNSSPDDFAWFVREVRAEFKARVAEEAAGGGGGV